MIMIWTKAFWKGLGERAIRTLAQSLAAALVVMVGDGAGLLDVGWVEILSVAGLTTLASVLTSIGTPDFVAGTPAVAAILPADLVELEEEDEFEPDDGEEFGEVTEVTYPPVPGDDQAAYVDGNPRHGQEQPR